MPPNQASYRFRKMTWVSLKIVNLQTCGYVLRNDHVCGFICGMPCFISTHICCFRSSTLTDTKPWQSPWQRLKHRTAMLPALAVSCVYCSRKHESAVSSTAFLRCTRNHGNGRDTYTVSMFWSFESCFPCLCRFLALAGDFGHRL